MRVAELIQLHQFRLSEMPLAAPAPGEVQVRVEACGICGSDLHYFSEGGISGTRSVFPMVLGHEPAGTVTAVGDGVTGWSAGDRVVLEPALYCYHCPQCLSGHHNICENLRFLSSPPDPGFFREYVNLPATNVVPLPAGLSFAEGTLAEPLAVVLHSLNLARPGAGCRVAVFGAGPIGLLTICALKLDGAARIWSIEPVAARRELALAIGADAAIDPAQADPVRELLADTGARGVDYAFDCATRGSSLRDAVASIRNGGVLVITGIPSEAASAFDLHVMRRKEMVVYNVRRSNHETEVAIDLLREHRARLRPMLTHEVTFDRLQHAFDTLEHYGDGMAKVIVAPR